MTRLRNRLLLTQLAFSVVTIVLGLTWTRLDAAGGAYWYAGLIVIIGGGLFAAVSVHAYRSNDRSEASAA